MGSVMARGFTSFSSLTAWYLRPAPGSGASGTRDRQQCSACAGQARQPALCARPAAEVRAGGGAG